MTPLAPCSPRPDLAANLRFFSRLPMPSGAADARL